MTRKIDILTSEFKLGGQALRSYQNWLEGFEGHDKGLGRALFRGSAQKGWDASALITRLRRKYPGAKLSGHLAPIRFASA